MARTHPSPVQEDAEQPLKLAPSLEDTGQEMTIGEPGSVGF